MNRKMLKTRMLRKLIRRKMLKITNRRQGNLWLNLFKE